MFPVSVQKVFINYSINGLLIQVLLWGIYTVVYLGTVYVYVSKKTSRHWIVIGAISLSYIGYSTDALLVWYLTQNEFINDSETRETLFLSQLVIPAWLTLVNDIIIFGMAAMADSILIWRCYNVCDHSIRAILVPSLLLFCEVTIDLILIVLQCAEHFQQTSGQAKVLNDLLSTQGFITFATTLSATLIIAFRIYKASAQGSLNKKSRRLFRQVAEVLIQSAALYSVAALVYAIPSAIPLTLSNIAPLNGAWIYSSILFLFAMGISPTLIVARVAFLDDKTDNVSVASRQLSGLEFHMQSTTKERSQITWLSSKLDHEGSAQSRLEGVEAF